MEENQVVEQEVQTPTEPVTEISDADKYQQALVEIAKLKKATDRATSEAANFKRQLRDKQSADEIALQEKAEKEAVKEEKFQQLLKENSVNKFAKSFLKLGYSEEMADKAALAQYDGDTETLFKLQSDFQATLLKQKESEWLKSRPEPQIGVGEDGETSITKEQFNKMTYLQRVEFAEKHPKLYDKYK